MPERVLIVGAGYTGDRLAAVMRERQYDVLTASRQPASVPGTTTVVIDLDDSASCQDTLATALAGDASLTIAYLVPPADLQPDSDADDPRLTALLSALPALPARVVLASTSGVYGDRGGDMVDENTPLRPQTRRARNRVRLERTLAQWAQPRAVSTVILRIAGIYGPGRLPLSAIREQQPIIDPAQSGPGNRIHVDDLVRSFEAAMTEAELPAIINVADGDHCTTSDFTLAVAELAGLPAPPVISLAEAQRSFSPMRLSFVNESRRLDTRRLRRLLGNGLRYASHRDGIIASLAAESGSLATHSGL